MNTNKIKEFFNQEISILGGRKLIVILLTCFLIFVVLATFADVYTKFRFVQTSKSTPGTVLRTINDGYECLEIEKPNKFTRRREISQINHRVSLYKHCAIVTYKVGDEVFETKLKGASVFPFEDGERVTVYYNENNPMDKIILVDRWDLYYSEIFLNITVSLLVVLFLLFVYFVNPF